MTTDIKVLDEKGEIVSWDDLQWEDTGIGNVAPSFPIIKIVQGTSTMEGAGKHGGDFWRSDTEEYASTLDVVPLLRRETRALFEQGNNSPICMSPDGVKPLANQPVWMSTNITTIDMGQKGIHPVPEFAPDNCASCPFSQWGEDGAPPLCGSSDVLLVDVDGDLAQLRIGGKSIGVVKNFIRRRLATKRLPLFAFRLRLSTVEKSEPGKKWHELVIVPEALTPTEARQYNDLLAQYRSAFDARLREKDETAVEWPSDVAPAGSWETAD